MAAQPPVSMRRKKGVNLPGFMACLHRRTRSPARSCCDNTKVETTASAKLSAIDEVRAATAGPAGNIGPVCAALWRAKRRKKINIAHKSSGGKEKKKSRIANSVEMHRATNPY